MKSPTAAKRRCDQHAAFLLRRSGRMQALHLDSLMYQLMVGPRYLKRSLGAYPDVMAWLRRLPPVAGVLML